MENQINKIAEIIKESAETIGNALISVSETLGFLSKSWSSLNEEEKKQFAEEILNDSPNLAKLIKLLENK
jgi:hypothetical protein